MDDNVFLIKDCMLLPIATGVKAQSLRELRMEIEQVESESIYYHFWGSLLTPRFVEPEFMNDFASWAFHALHDHVLAERLSVIDPVFYKDMEKIREALLDTIDDRLDELEVVPFSAPEDEFHFVKSQMVVFDTRRIISKPEELPDVICSFSRGSLFYHFIDARRRTYDGVDDLSLWLKSFGDRYMDLVNKLKRLDPYFVSLAELKERLKELFSNYFMSGEGENDRT